MPKLMILVLAGLLTSQAVAGPVPGDFDGDCDVDRDDFTHFKACALGATIPQIAPVCADARIDGDQDVDLDDFGIFQRCYSGAGNPADPNCNDTCSGDHCDCPCGQTSCSGACTSTASDNANCGLCGNVCTAGATCIEGICWPNASCDPDDVSSPCYCGPDHPYYPNCCPSGQTVCGVCTDTETDNANCGACGNVCGDGLVCQNGACAPCGQPFTACSGVCVDLTYNNAHCGGCGHVCGTHETCIGGYCEPLGACPPGAMSCDGWCRDVTWDNGNCGACGAVCPDQTACAWGVCEGICIGCGY